MLSKYCKTFDSRLGKSLWCNNKVLGYNLEENEFDLVDFRTIIVKRDMSSLMILTPNYECHYWVRMAKVLNNPSGLTYH